MVDWERRAPFIVDLVYNRGYLDGTLNRECPYGADSNKRIWQMGYDDAQGDRQLRHQGLADQTDL